ncbi:MAG: hypothetical protein WKG07_37580 [Hymenobacter sp.]
MPYLLAAGLLAAPAPTPPPRSTRRTHTRLTLWWTAPPASPPAQVPG